MKDESENVGGVADAVDTRSARRECRQRPTGPPGRPTSTPCEPGRSPTPARGCDRGGPASASDGRGGPHHSADRSGRTGHTTGIVRGRRQLIAYFHAWEPGEPAAAQCPGCTFYNGQVRELSYLHSRDVTYATFCKGPYDESVRYRDFMGWDVPWYSVQDSAEALLAGRPVEMFYLVCYLRHGDRVFETYWTTGRGVEVMAPSYGLLDLTVYGRQETWEDSPAHWPRTWTPGTEEYRSNGRPTAQWSRLAAGRSDVLGSTGSPTSTSDGSPIDTGQTGEARP
jgi:Bacterial protein of unknown function (DUF899)